MLDLGLPVTPRNAIALCRVQVTISSLKCSIIRARMELAAGDGAGDSRTNWPVRR